MRTRPLGETGISISELTLGTWGLSGDGYGPVDPNERDEVIDRALELGITTFETADAYARGDVETALGERLAGKSPTYIITKVGTYRPASESYPPPPNEQAFKRFEPDYLHEAVKLSRERLRRKIDVVLLHNPSASTMSRGDAAAAMKQLKESGLIGAWGVSAGDNYVARAAIAQGAEVVELAYNIFFSRDLNELSAELQGAKVGLLARSVLSYGLLAGHFAANRQFDPGDHRLDRWTRSELETRLRHLDAVRPLVQGPVLTLRAAAVRFVLANELVSSAVLGPKNIAQLEQLVRESETEPPYLSNEALTRLSTDLARVGVVT